MMPDDPARSKPAQPSQKKKTIMQEVLSWVLTLVFAAALALLVRTFVFQLVVVKGTSMADTLNNQEVLWTTRYDYLWGSPERFDVVICHYPGRTENFVKRVVGLPGDTVEIIDGYLFINGERQEETYLTRRGHYTMPATTLLPNRYFVLGDNRDHSNDSHLIGSIDRSQIVGHVRTVLLPIKNIRGVE